MNPLLKTKLHIPSPGKLLVERRDLIDQLGHCLDPEVRLTLISAPAGFGKSTLVSSWIHSITANRSEDSIRPKIAWLSLDEGDSDPVLFWTYITTAFQRQNEEIGNKTLELLSVQGVPMETRLAALINDLADEQSEYLLVLDDYHLVRSLEIHRLLTYFIDHMPENVHLIIASRTDPPLPLASMRARGQLHEFRLGDLRFSDQEAVDYFRKNVDPRLAEETIQKLNLKTEGWIAGLQLAAVSLNEPAMLSEPQKLNAFVTAFSGSNRYILDYLVEEVLNRQPEEIQQFLIRTSILERLCAQLVDAVLGGENMIDPQAVLENLESSNLFIIPLDQERYWYRYHHLFADLLRKRLLELPAELVNELHARAVNWYEENGLIRSAIRHAFLMKDHAKAVSLVARITEEMWGRGEHATLLSWLDVLPDEAKKPYPHILTFQVSMLISAGKLQEAEACIPILEEFIQETEREDSTRSPLTGRVSALRTYIASFYGEYEKVVVQALHALQHLDKEKDAAQRCGVLLVLGNAYLEKGDLLRAGEIFTEAIVAAEKACRPHMGLTGRSNLAVVLYMRGLLKAAAEVCQAGFEIIEQYGMQRSPMAVDLLAVRGMILTERNQLEEAQDDILKSLELAQAENYIWQTARAKIAAAHFMLVKGKLQEAEAYITSDLEWVKTHKVPTYLSTEVNLLMCELSLRGGQIGEAEKCLEALPIPPDADIQFPFQNAYLALARCAWLRENLAESRTLLKRVLDWSERNQFLRLQIESLILMSLAELADQNRQESLVFLQQALDLSENDGYRLVFLKECMPIKNLLHEIASRYPETGYAKELLADFPDDLETGDSAASDTLEKTIKNRTIGPTDLLVDPLSPREMELLQLIAAGHSNKEIAGQMFISLRTVKYYATGLYNKLGVDSRMQAVVRARELGLL